MHALVLIGLDLGIAAEGGGGGDGMRVYDMDIRAIKTISCVAVCVYLPFLVLSRALRDPRGRKIVVIWGVGVFIGMVVVMGLQMRFEERWTKGNGEGEGDENGTGTGTGNEYGLERLCIADDGVTTLEREVQLRFRDLVFNCTYTCFRMKGSLIRSRSEVVVLPFSSLSLAPGDAAVVLKGFELGVLVYCIFGTLLVWCAEGPMFWGGYVNFENRSLDSEVERGSCLGARLFETGFLLFWERLFARLNSASSAIDNNKKDGDDEGSRTRVSPVSDSTLRSKWTCRLRGRLRLRSTVRLIRVISLLLSILSLTAAILVVIFNELFYLRAPAARSSEAAYEIGQWSIVVSAVLAGLVAIWVRVDEKRDVRREEREECEKVEELEVVALSCCEEAGKLSQRSLEVVKTEEERIL